MSSKLLLLASVVFLAYCVSQTEASRGDPNQLLTTKDRSESISLSLSCFRNCHLWKFLCIVCPMSRQLGWQGWHHVSGIPQWVTAWACVALFVGIVTVFIKCGKEDFNL